jgi:TetR/AcrR family transcriptional regulator, mexJK operon transcriptional repressor
MHAGAKRRPGRPPGPQVPEAETRAVVVRAAAELFYQRGYAAVSISDIAAAVGVTKATLYYYFTGKDAIYAAVMSWTLTSIAAAIRSLAHRPKPIRERLLALAYQALESAHPEANLDAMLRDVSEHLTVEQRTTVAAAHEDLLAAYEELMQSGIARGELRGVAPRLLAHAFQHLMEAFVGARAANFPDQRVAVTTAVELFLDGAGVGGQAAGVEPQQDGDDDGYSLRCC